MVGVSYKPFSVPSKYFERNARRKYGREAQRKDRYTGEEKQGGEDDSCRTDAPQLR
jgi:hypothetical protein